MGGHYLKYLHKISHNSQEGILLPSANILFHFDSVHTELSILININYLRDIRSGNEESAFRIVQDGSLRTAKKFNHGVRDQYVLQIRVFDNGTPPLFSDSYGRWKYFNIKVISAEKTCFSFFSDCKHHRGESVPASNNTDGHRGLLLPR